MNCPPPRPSVPTTSGVSCQGSLLFPAPPTHTPTCPNPPPTPSGAFYTLLRGTTLHLHRSDPFAFEDDAHDGAEVARIALKDRGWNFAKRGAGNASVIVFERTQEAGSGGGGRRGGGIAKKRSSPGLGHLAESTNTGSEKEGSKSLGEKLALRLGKRHKSISTAGPLLDVPSEGEDDASSLSLGLASAKDADMWVEAINAAFQLSLSPALPTSASLPGSLSAFANSRPPPPSASSRRPRTAQTTMSDGLPPTFNPSRRPSFLDRPPTSPRSYITLTAASPEGKKRLDEAPGPTSTVPSWIQAVRTAAATAADAADLEEVRGLKPKRSSSLLGSQGRTSLSIEGSRSEDSASEGGHGGGPPLSRSSKLLGFLGKKSSAKAEMPPTKIRAVNLGLQHLVPPPAVYNDPRRSGSSTSLSESLSETHSTSGASSADVPLTPEYTRDLPPVPFKASSCSSRPRLPPSRPSTAASDATTRSGARSLSPRPTPSSAHSRLSSAFASAYEVRMDRSSSAQSSVATTMSGTSASTTATTEPSCSELFDHEDFPVPRRRVEEWRSTFGRRVVSTNDLRKRDPTAVGSSASEGEGAAAEPFMEHIIKPSDLISQMRNELGWDHGKSLRTRRSNGALRAASASQRAGGALMGGLTPPPRMGSSSASRTNLAGIVAGRRSPASPAKSRGGGEGEGGMRTPTRAPSRGRSLSIGVLEGEKEGSGEEGEATPVRASPVRRMTLAGGEEQV